ncbi:unnamed protein product, partial [marine sediment metagenome]
EGEIRQRLPALGWVHSWPMREHFRAALEKAIAGDLSPKEALDEAAQKMNQLLKDYAELYGG